MRPTLFKLFLLHAITMQLGLSCTDNPNFVVRTDESNSGKFNGVAIDSSNNAYVVGHLGYTGDGSTSGTCTIMPVSTAGAVGSWQKTLGSSGSPYCEKVKTVGNKLFVAGSRTNSGVVNAAIYVLSAGDGTF